MQSLMEQVFALLETTQASLILYLFSITLLFISLVMVVNYWNQIPSGYSKRLVAGLLIMLFMELATITVNLWLSNDPAAAAWLPPIDRFQQAFLLIWLMWLWAFPESSPWMDGLVVLLSIGSIVVFALTLNAWSLSGSSAGFNGKWMDTGWQLACLGYLILTVIIVYARHKSLWGVGTLMGLLFAAGHLLQILNPNLFGNYPGPLRLFVLVALPLALVLPGRFITAPSITHSADMRPGRDKRERRRFSTELPTALGFLRLAWEDNPLSAMRQLVQSIGQALRADVCFFTTQPNPNGEVTILAGYDFHNHQEIKETSLSSERIPLITDVLTKSRNLRLPEDYSDTPDIASFCRLVNFDGTSPLLVHPINKSNAWQIGGIIFLTPYNRRVWEADDSAYVGKLADGLLQYIEQNQSRLDTAGRIQKLVDGQRDSAQTITKLETELMVLNTQLETAHSQMAAFESVAASRQAEPAKGNGRESQAAPFFSKGRLRDATIDLDTRVVEKADAIREVARLKEENNALRQLIEHVSLNAEKPAAQPGSQLEKELHLSLEEVARLKNMLADADMKIRQLDRQLKGGT